MFSSFLESLKNAFFKISHALILPLRYEIELVGSDCLDPKKGGVNSSILFLANHTSHMDGTILSVAILQKKVPLTVWALDQTFKLPYLRWVASNKNVLQVVKVPNINERRSQKHVTKLHKLVSRTGDGLKKGKNFLIFPSGKCKNTPIEKMDGKSAIPLIIQQCPNIHIILIRISGLWGSRFSGAVRSEVRWGTGAVSLWQMLWQSIKMIVFNGVFFIPKRKILIEMVPAEDHFPRFGSRLEINRYLEKFFNEKWGQKGEHLYRVPDYFWKVHYAPHEYQTKQYTFDIKQVPKSLRNHIVTLVADKCDRDCKEVDFEMQLGRDLGLDSLDVAEILTELESKYFIDRLVPEDLTTVGHLIAIAAKIPIKCEISMGDFHEVTDHIPLSTRLMRKIKSVFTF
jgi:long-chain-fatty-acid--[acyl-carrier-protein] ligase